MTKPNRIKKQRRNAGFSLIELLVVIGIMGILASVYMGMFSGNKEAKGTQCTSALRNIYTATSAAATSKMWASTADINDNDILKKLNGLTPNTDKSLKCSMGGTYDWGKSRGWDAKFSNVKKPTCTLGPGSQATDSDNATFPSTLHNIRNDDTE